VELFPISFVFKVPAILSGQKVLMTLLLIIVVVLLLFGGGGYWGRGRGYW
jgi:hypothetical protein